jgi:ERCC4-type nuclease
MTIFVDSAETRSGIPDYLKKMGVPVQVVDLEVGDYLVGGICVERKTASDYVASLIDGRLHNQLFQMSHSYPISVLVIEGYIEEVLFERKINRESYISSLAGDLFKRAPSGHMGSISVITLSTPYDTALFLKHLRRKWIEGEFRLPTITKPPEPQEVLVSILSVFPGIGEKRARLLLRRFGSLNGVLNASLSELMSVKGLPRNVAESLYRLSRMEYTPPEGAGVEPRPSERGEGHEVGGEV